MAEEDASISGFLFSLLWLLLLVLYLIMHHLYNLHKPELVLFGGNVVIGVFYYVF
jgi:hypothetical protein